MINSLRYQSFKHYNLIILISLNSIKYSFSTLLLANFKGSWIKPGLRSVPSKPNYSTIVGFYHYFLADFQHTKKQQMTNSFLWQLLPVPKKQASRKGETPSLISRRSTKDVGNTLCLKGNSLILFNNFLNFKIFI